MQSEELLVLQVWFREILASGEWPLMLLPRVRVVFLDQIPELHPEIEAAIPGTSIWGYVALSANHSG